MSLAAKASSRARSVAADLPTSVPDRSYHGSLQLLGKLLLASMPWMNNIVGGRAVSGDIIPALPVHSKALVGGVSQPRHRTAGVDMAQTLSPGDTVVVIGASGNVGKLVSLRLSKNFKVRGIVRDASKVRSFLPESIDLFEVDLKDAPDVRDQKMQAALAGAQAVVVCTGTTAFPTKAWSANGENEVTGAVLSALLNTKFNVKDAISRLDAEGLNTPRNVDEIGTRTILTNWAAAAGPNRKRFVMMSSIGVQRRDQMPFPILNACGVLDAKAAGEAAIQADAAQAGYTYTVVRPGQLFGGPYDNNFYLGTLFELDKEKPQDVQVALGDSLTGDTLRSTLAEVIASILEGNRALDCDFSVVNVDGTPPSLEDLQERLTTLSS